MSESDLRGRVVRGLRALDAVSVENHVYPGTPDVNYVEGWLELKWVRRWPRGADTPVRVEHFTQEQRVWLRRRATRGGRVHLLLQCRHEYVLLDGLRASVLLGEATREQLVDAAVGHWTNGINWRELRLLLSDGRVA